MPDGSIWVCPSRYRRLSTAPVARLLATYLERACVEYRTAPYRHEAVQQSDQGLQAKTVASLGSVPLSSVVLPVGLVQSGPSPAGATGSEIIANGPAWCSPLNGVGLLTSKPHGAASSGLLNQN